MPSEKSAKEPPLGAEGHRNRLISRFLNESPDSLEDHRLLELVLFFAVPRKDTREQAMALIKRFGSFSGVFSASYRELQTVDGIGHKSAVLLMAVSALIRRTSLSMQDKRLHYASVEEVGKLLCEHFTCLQEEAVFVASFDENRHLIELIRLKNGSVNETTLTLRELLTRLDSPGTTSIAVAHNHPHGILLPSVADLEFTRQLLCTTELIGVELIEHFLVADGRFYPIVKNNLL